MSELIHMYQCDNCGKTFTEPKYAYAVGDAITTSDSELFSEMQWAHEGGWIYCPNCGSENILDLNDIQS